LGKQFLFTPGPVNVAANVRLAVSSDDICHREQDFDCLLSSIETKLLSLLQIRKPELYRAVVITGSGTAANEAILSSVVGDGNILVLSNGEFGERLHKISLIHNSRTHLVQVPWGQAINLAVIEEYLQDHSIDVIAMVHHETCSGMLNSISGVGKLAKRYDALFVVDGVSSIGAEPINMEADNIDFCSSSSSKAIGSYAGLSFVVGRTQQFEKLKYHRAKTTYLNLATFYDFLKSSSQTPNTPGVPLFFALDQALSNILKEGVSNRHSTIKGKAKSLRDGMTKLGLKFVLEEKDMCSMLTTVQLPEKLDIEKLRQKLREKSIIIYEGKGCYKGNSFQVGNIGELSNADIKFFLDCLKDILLAARFKAAVPVPSPSLLVKVWPFNISDQEALEPVGV
jgi:2-aminoethylphosphonate-pyruvate transaminase